MNHEESSRFWRNNSMHHQQRADFWAKTSRILIGVLVGIALATSFILK